eukprot:gb/GFBE01023206.1/.p1 GENE.gb/GFBE01023206.1/~~gb/GFBE01023206.1/.p1  ORF type:complete len:233 (+),score=26.52 gb/GFBE01023206.1/:1-699(+)
MIYDTSSRIFRRYLTPLQQPQRIEVSSQSRSRSGVPLSGIPIPIPDDLREFSEEKTRWLMGRIMTEDWYPWFKEEIPQDHHPDNNFLLHAQRKMGMKCSNNTEKACANCGIDGPGFQKCATCLQAYYCSRQCQNDHWKTHRRKCTAPHSKISPQIFLAIPEYDCFKKWLVWTQLQPKSVVKKELAGMMMINRETFKKQFGEDAVLITTLHLAETGRPHPYLMARLARASGIA